MTDSTEFPKEDIINMIRALLIVVEKLATDSGITVEGVKNLV